MHINEFEREKIVYHEANESMRRLDQSMWQVPLVGTTLTGGLWFGVVSTEALPPIARTVLLLFAAVGDLFLIAVLMRLKQIIDLHLWQIRRFERRPQLDAVESISGKAPARRFSFRRFRVVYSFSVLLGGAGLISILGAIHYAPTRDRANVTMRSFQNLDVVAENASAVAVRDAYPISPGHTLIIPKRQVTSVFALSDQELLDCWRLLKSERERLTKDLSPQGFNVGVNDGEAAGQTVARAHIHLIPRYLGDHPHPVGGVRSILPGEADYTRREGKTKLSGSSAKPESLPSPAAQEPRR